MSSRPYMRFYIGDYLSDTIHLSCVEHGAYILFICAYWRQGKPLSDDDQQLAKLARLTTREWKRVRPTLEAMFQVGNGEWRHKRIEAELAKLEGKSNKATESAVVRWSKEKDHANALQSHAERNAYAMRTHSERNAIHIQNQIQNQIGDVNQGSSPEITPPQTGGVISPDSESAAQPAKRKGGYRRVEYAEL